MTRDCVFLTRPQNREISMQ